MSIAVATTALVALAACSGSGSSDGGDGDLVTVTVGTTNSSSDAPLYIADAHGYFEEEGIEVEFVPFGSAAEMIAPLGSGGLDVGGGSPSAGLFNALARDVTVRVVSDKSHAIEDNSYMALLAPVFHEVRGLGGV